MTEIKFFEERVQAELSRLKVLEEAKKRYEQERVKGFEMPEGVLVYDDLPLEPAELLDGLLLTHGATGIIAEKEAGKTLTALEIQSSLLTGAPLWGEIKPTKTVAKTVHFLAEHSSWLLNDFYRFTKLPKAGELRAYGPEHLREHKLLVSNGMRREQAVGIYKRLAEGAGLVVFDPLAAFIQGQSAENDNSPMRNLVDTMIEIAQSTGAACLVLAHQGKPQMYQGRKIKRTSYATRGASATEDALAAVHYLQKMDGVRFGGNDMYEIRPVHYKGRKSPPFRLVRDAKTCRQTLLARSITLE